MQSKETFRRYVSTGIAFFVLSFSLSLVGCDEVREEKILDVEAPGVDIEVNKVEGDDGVESVEIEAGPSEE